MEQVGFALLFALFVAAWVLSIGEAIGMWRFWPRVYGTGVRALHETRSLPLPTLATGSEFETKSGKFKIIAPEFCLFRPHMSRDDVHVYTPFPVKGSLRWNGDRAAIEGRFPVCPALFIAAWLVGFTTGMAKEVSKGNLVGGLTTLFLVWAVTAAICLWSIPFEIRRAKRILREYEAQVGDWEAAVTAIPQRRREGGKMRAVLIWRIALALALIALFALTTFPNFLCHRQAERPASVQEHR